LLFTGLIHRSMDFNHVVHLFSQLSEHSDPTRSLYISFLSPNFLHFLGSDRGRHPGLPSGVAGVTRRDSIDLGTFRVALLYAWWAH
jgi:hypothetical protein